MSDDLVFFTTYTAGRPGEGLGAVHRMYCTLECKFQSHDLSATSARLLSGILYPIEKSPVLAM